MPLFYQNCMSRKLLGLKWVLREIWRMWECKNPLTLALYRDRLRPKQGDFYIGTCK